MTMFSFYPSASLLSTSVLLVSERGLYKRGILVDNMVSNELRLEWTRFQGTDSKIVSGTHDWFSSEEI